MNRSVWPKEFSDEEVEALVRDMPDARLAERYQQAAKYPGTVWHQVLSAEIGRRDALGGQRP